MSSLYVLFHDKDTNTFKIGKHTGDVGKLMSRYRTHSSKKYTVIAFYPGFGHLETCIHNHLHEHRLHSAETGRLSEWFKCDIDKILFVIAKFIKNDLDIILSKFDNYSSYIEQENVKCHKHVENLCKGMEDILTSETFTSKYFCEDVWDRSLHAGGERFAPGEWV